MKKIDSANELKQIQLDILLSLHKYCNDNKINYSLAAGTLIGAIRHKGFIPWDDDIDVYLLRDDYVRLVSSFPDMYDGRYKLVSLERDQKWKRAYAKLYDGRTIEIEKSRNRYTDLGIGIDVFPIDDVPDDPDDWDHYERRRRFFRNMMALKSLLLSKDRSAAKNILVVLGRFILCPVSFSFMARLMDKNAQLYNGKGYNHVYENCLGVYNSKRPWLKKDLIEVIDAPFENHSVKIMKGYDDYLTCVYGNYMQLPPEEKRVTHHSFEAYWK